MQRKETGMRYLFFDLECADGFRAICEFGYVITDENFNVIREANVLIDPECKITLSNSFHTDGIKLTYSNDEYSKFYPFDDSYEMIKSLLNQTDLIVFGYSVENDMSFIFKDCMRYDLPLFNYDAFDVQKMLPLFNKENKKHKSLESASKELIPGEVLEEFKNHRACDDAKKTMLVFKAMVNGSNTTSTEFIKACSNTRISALEYWNDFFKKSEVREKKLKMKKLRKDGINMWNKFCEEYENELGSSPLTKNFVIVSTGIIEHHSELNEIIQLLKSKGYFGSTKIYGTKFFVTFSQEEADEIEARFKSPYKGEMITFKEFMERNK